MGLFGGNNDTKSKIEELRAKMQGGAQPPQGWQPPQQPWQQQAPQYQPPQQAWQPPREERRPEPPRVESFDAPDDFQGIVLDLGDGMSLNLPVKGHMRLDEFLRIADRVRELKKIEHQSAQQHY